MSTSPDLDPVGTIQDSGTDIQKAVLGGIAGIITVMATAFGIGVDAITELFTQPLYSLATELGELISAYIPAELLDAAVETSAESLGQFGPLAYPAGAAIMAAGLYVIARLMTMEITSDLIPFTFTDWPLLGADEEDEEAG